MRKKEAIRLLERALENCHAGIRAVPKAEHYHGAVACDVRGALDYLRRRTRRKKADGR